VRRVLGGRVPQKDRITKTGVAAEKIGGANSAWITTGVISTFSSVFIIITIIKGE
jgi:hypothetical protein